MAGDQGRRDNQRFSLVLGERCLGNIKTRFTGKQVALLWEFWRGEEIEQGQQEDHFHEWLLTSGFAEESDSGNNLELEL